MPVKTISFLFGVFPSINKILQFFQHFIRSYLYVSVRDSWFISHKSQLIYNYLIFISITCISQALHCHSVLSLG